jgi:hypothetical protein
VRKESDSFLKKRTEKLFLRRIEGRALIQSANPV